MDDEDEVKQSSSTVEQPIAEAPEVGETRVSEQCDVVLSVEDDSVKSLSMANNAENVEESKVEDAKVEEMVPAVVVGSEDAELEVRNEKVVEERENEGANVEESKSEVAKVETDGEGSVEKLVADDDVVGMKEDELVEEKKEEEALIEEAKEEELAVKANEEASNYKLKEEEELVEEKKEEEALVEEAKEEELIEEEKEEELAVDAKEEELAVEANEEASNYKSKEEEELVDGAKEEVIEEASIKESKEEGLVEEASIKESKEEGLVEEAREEALIEESKEEELVEEAKEEELIEEQKEEALDEDMKQDESIEEKVENENKGEHSEDVVMVKEEGEDRLKTENLVEVECGDEAAKADKVVQEGGEEVEKGDDEEEDGGGKEMEDSEGYGDEEVSRMVVEDEEVVKEEEMPNTDTEMEKESEVVKSGSGGKRRRGRSSKLSTPVKSPAKSPSRKTVGEDVCFICLDGGDLVLCDRRGCPKAYHPSCVDHDEEFFKTKGRWNCGWHLCNQCGKNAYFLCYTCTFSLCKGCSKDAVIFCLRGSKGFCESCMKTVMMIESNEQNEMGAAFDDKSSWEYLFKDYWIEQKAKLGISSDELAQAKNPLRDYDASDRRQKPVELDDNDDVGTDSDNSPANIEMSDSKRKRAKRTKPVGSGTDSSSEEAGTAKKKSKRRLKSQAKDTYSDPEHTLVNQGTSRGKRVRRLSKSHSKDGGAISGEGNIEWASQELLEFVMHMKNGDSSVLTQFDVQGLLLEYIKRNKLRDPRRQSQIICDSMLQKLFGKARVGHFEMLKLLESHFLLKEDSHVDDNQGNVVDTEISPDDHNDDSGKMRGRKSRKRAEDRGQSNLEDYAAIDRHNISLIYLRRGLMESLMDDADMFHEKVIGSFVRIRISGSSQKQDIYRLVQIVGTSKAPEAYKVGKRTTDAMLEILNLDKTEIVSIDSISNQEFTEDECKRLRQSIKCGLISRMTVGDVLEKARELQEVRVTDWLEAEIVRLSHLRDRASEKGRKKELRECVEKLQLLKTPEERQRRLNETPEVHADPKMDPSCVSDDENENLDKRQASNIRPRDSGFFRRSRDNFSSRKVGSVSNDSWSANVRPSNQTTELGRNLSNKGVSGRREDSSVPSLASDHSWSNGVDRGTPRSNNWEKPKIISDTPMSTQVEHSGRRSDLSVAAASEPVQPSSAAGQIDVKVNETEKTWHYRDPTGKVQGPFSMSQLRKWSNTGYFPAQLRIWRTSQMEDDSILLTEALDGKFQKESQTVMSNSDVGSKVRNTPSSVDTVKLSGSRYDSTILPSPTPTRSPAAWSGKQTSSIFQSTAQFCGNERLPSPTPTSPSSDPSSVDRSNIPQQSKGNVVGNRQENVVASIGTVQPAPAQFASNSGMASAQQFSSQSVLNVANQPFAPPDAAMNQTIVGPNAVGCGQGFSNMVQPGTGQNPPIYTQNWGAGYVTRPEMVNANLTPNNQTAVQPAQYSQWTGASVGNQAPPYAGGYPPGQGNIAANFPAMPMNTAWRPGQTNMSWAGQQQQLQLQQQQQQLQLQQQPVGQNAGWTGPSSGSMAQMAPSPSTPAMAPGPASAGWSGTGPSPTPGNTNMVWVGAPGNSGTWGGDQNRNGGGTQPQWNRQSSFGSGGQRVCKYFREHGNCRKGSSCDYMHT